MVRVLKTKFFSTDTEFLISTIIPGKAKLIRYLTDESITFTEDEFSLFLVGCFPSRNPDVEDQPYYSDA